MIKMEVPYDLIKNNFEHMKKIALIGGGCATGKTFIQEAVDREYIINALIPNPFEFSLIHDNLNIIEGSSENYDKVKEMINQTDAVVIFSLEENLSLINNAIISNLNKALKESHLTRMICVIPAAFILENDIPGSKDNFNTFWFKLFHKRAFEQINDIIPDIIDSNFDWTLIRAPRLTDGPLEKIYEMGEVGMKSSRYISRKDLSYFILQIIEEQKYIKHSIYISN